MSIIYEALKKAQRRFKISPTKSENKEYFIWFYLGFIFISSLGFIFVLFLIFYTPKTDLAAPKRISKVQDSSKTTFTSFRNIKYEAAALEFPEISLKLNGIIYMDGEYIALINNSILRKGDFIEGAKIIGIYDKRVDFNFRDKGFSLHIKQ